VSRDAPRQPLRIAIVGSGNVGGYLGVALGAGGAHVWMLYRTGRAEGDSAACVIDRRGAAIPRGSNVVLTEDPGCLDGAELCLVCVKAHQTPGAVELLRDRRGPRWIVSLQNGLESAEALREVLGPRVLAGVVTFNVTRDASGTRRQANRGGVVVDDRPEARGDLGRFATALRAPGVPVALRPDIDRVRAHKLLLNLNNGVCAATGLSVSEVLADRDARWCVAACLREGDRIVRAAGYAPARVGLLSARGIARIMALPGALLTLGGRLTGMASAATRPSTLQDLDRGRPTEIEALNGAIVRMAQRVGRRAPANAAVTETVHAHERAVVAGERPRYPSPRVLRKRMEA
jgi:2-dehydropantoate 2-reductase